MKKLSKLKLKEFREMNDFEMRQVVGGYGGMSNCAANQNWEDQGNYKCFNSADEAMQYAGERGHWCCNCSTAYNRCGQYV